MLPSLSVENSFENPFDSTTKVNSPATPHLFSVQKKIIEEYGEKIGPYGISVYTVLCYLADTSGVCSPSIGQIARIAQCGESTVRRVIHLMKAHSLLDVVPIYNRDGGQCASQYMLRPLDVNPTYRTNHSMS